jgi:maltose O-acetyltransferase
LTPVSFVMSKAPPGLKNPRSGEAAPSVRPAVGPREDVGSVQARFLAVEVLFRRVPPFVFGRMRTHAMRAAGIKIGRASCFWGLPTLVGTGDVSNRLVVGAYCGFNKGVFFDLEDRVTIGDHVAVGHDVMFLTRTHRPGTGAQRAGELLRAPVVIEDGVWLGARCTIMPGVTVGAGSVIGSSVVVEADVPPNTLLTGAQKVSLAKWR